MILGYMRISTKDKQTTARQELALETYARNNKFSFDKLFEDKISGTIKTENRPEYSKLKDIMRSGDILVLTDLDRLGRDADNTITELKELKQKGIKVIALDIPMMNEWDKTKDDSMYAIIIHNRIF